MELYVETRVTRAEATRKADEDQKGLRQTLRTEVAVGARGPDGQLSPTMKRGRMAVNFAERPELLQNRRTGR